MSDTKKLKECVEHLLRENTADLRDLLQHVVQRIAGEFWKVGLIEKSVESSMGTRGVDKYALAKDLLDACHDSLVKHPREKFPKFIDILKGYETMKLLADDMESEFQRADQVLDYKPVVDPEPVPKPRNAQQHQQDLIEVDSAVPEEHQEAQQLGKQRKKSAKPVYAYHMKSSPHGQAVIFNFIGETDNKGHLPVGSSKSVDNLEATFKSLGYKVWTQPFLSPEEMIKRLTENIKEEDDSFVCCIMAHGDLGSIDAKGGKVNIKDLQKEVGEKCPKLRRKPKIFIIQACRGSKADHPMVASKEDKALSAQLSREADFYMAYSTTEGHISAINDKDGCRYLNKLCEVFEERADHLTLDEMVMEVHHELKGEVSNVTGYGEHIQMGQVVHTLRGPVRFNKT